MANDREDIRSSLFRAVNGGNLSKVRDIVNCHGLYYSLDWSAGYIFLRHAIQWGYTEIAKFLLQKGAKVNSLNPFVDTPLHFAARKGYVELAEMLINRHARIDAQNLEDETPLVIATQKSDEKMVELLLNRGANCCLPNFEPLHIVCKKAPENIFKLLLGVRLRQPGSSQSLHKALCIASDCGNEEMALALLNAGADPNPVTELYVASPENCSTKFSPSPLFSACQRGYMGILNLLLTHGGKVNCSHCANKASEWWPECHACKPLHGASENGHLDIVRCLLSNGADPRAEAEGKLTSLHLAAKNGHVEIVKLLLKNAADVNAQTDSGVTPLLSSVKHEHTKVVQVLLEGGASVNIKDEKNNSPLSLAVENRNSYLVNYLLQFKPELDDKIHDSVIYILIHCYGCSNIVNDLMNYGLILSREVVNESGLLPAAVRKGCVKVVEALLNYGVDPTEYAKFGSPLVHTAVEYEHEEIVALLLKSGCRVNVSEKTGAPFSYIMNYISSEKCARILQLLCTHGTNVKEASKLLLKAVCWEHFEICRILIENGVDVNVLDAEGRTLLHIILLYSNSSPIYVEEYKVDRTAREKIIKLLVSNGAELNFRIDDGSSVLHQALMKGRVDAVCALLECGVDMDSCDKDGFRPLYLAAHFGQKKAVEAFCNQKAAVDAGQRDGSTALHAACKKGHKEIAKILCEKGASVDARNATGLTPLFSAAIGGCAELVQILLDYNVDIDAQTVTGLTALHFAVWYKQCEMTTVLLENGCDINAEDNRGRTALDFVRAAVKSSRSTRNIYQHNWCDRTNMVKKILKNHVVKFKVAGLHVSKKILHSLDLNDELSLSYQQECQEEVGRLKCQKICCHLTLHHVLVNCGNPAFVRNEHLMQTLSSCDHKEFPIYRNLIVNSIKKSKPRIELLSSGQKSLDILLKTSNVFSDQKLPVLLFELLEEIVSYLNNKELQNLNNCAQTIKAQLSKS